MMTQHKQLYPGRYVAGDSLLHRLDPRCKLLAVLAVVAVCFMFTQREPLVILVLLLFFLLRFAAVPLLHYLRLLRSLRFLFLFTLLVYLLFTPGYRLWGVAWLSRDGLEQGVLVCLQLALALGFSLLLSTTTSPLALARGVERLLLPLRRLGLPVEQVGDSLVLVLYFLEHLFAELPERQVAAQVSRSLRMRLERAASSAGLLLERLLAHAEELALKMARGETPALSGDEVVRLRFAAREWLTLCATALLLLVLLKGWT